MNPYHNLDEKFSKIAFDFDKLNEFQKTAVLNEDKILLLNACVGSGKTTVLINKIIYLHIVKKIPFSKMFVLTFTNKVADEIKNRFKEYDILVTHDTTKFFGTFHSVAKKLLDASPNLEKIGFKPDFSIVDTDEMVELLNKIIEEDGLNIKYRDKVIKRIELRKKGILLFGNMKSIDDIELLYEKAIKVKKELNIMDFDDLLKYCIEILKINKENEYAKYIIVDEFQDCNEMQIEMIDLLSGKNTEIFAVGDPNQTIYTWRGSTLNVFQDFKEKNNAIELTLPINYRSTSTILDVAKEFLYDKQDLKGIREVGNPILITNHYNEFNDAIYTAEKIKELLATGYQYNDFSILYRKQDQAKVFEDILKKENIPFETSVRKTLKDISVLSWFIKLLKASINCEDKNCIINVLMNKNFGLTTKIADARAMLESSSVEKIDFVKKIYEFKKYKIGILEIYNYFEIDKFIKTTSVDYSENKNYIDKFIFKLKEFVELNQFEEISGLKNFLDNSSLYGTQIIEERINMEEKSVKLMTLHSAKGLEFKYVFITGANTGLIPMRNSNLESAEEEKRLFFVGVTRAKDNLEISYHTSPSGFGVIGRPSEYLALIPIHLKKYSRVMDKAQDLNIKDIVRGVVGNRGLDNVIKVVLSKEAIIQEALTEEKVKHNKYGVGKIISKNNGIITVLFEKYGEKSFVEEFENLEYLDKKNE